MLRYDRVVALLLSTGVTLFALLAGVGVIGTGVGATPGVRRARHQVTRVRVGVGAGLHRARRDRAR